jgi:HAAS domain-containing protein
MTTAPLAHTDIVVLDYLAALWAQSDDLSPDQRDSLMNTVADYIAARRVAAVDPLEDAAAIVRRLGPPEDLVAAMRRGALPPHVRLPALLPPPAAPPTPPVRSGGGPAEYTAIGMLSAGAFVLPVIAPVAGMLLATASPHWTPAQKSAGWVLTIGSVAGAFFFGLLLAAVSPYSDTPSLFLVYLVMLAGSLGAGGVLLSGLRNRSA